jgi:hypothetical protein
MFTIENLGRTGEHAMVDVVNSNDLAGQSFDPGIRRPYLAENGRVYVDVTTGFKPRQDKEGNFVRNKQGDLRYDRQVEPQLVSDRLQHGLPTLHVDNATTLTKDQWIRLDAVVMKAARQRLRAWSDLRSANTFGGFDGMATPILEHEIMTDPGEAIADMEGLAEGRNSAPKFALQGLPLPITHSDFYLPQRFLAASRNKGQPQDTLRAEIAGRRVGELIEKTLIGSVAGTVYGQGTSAYLRQSQVYGYKTHPAIQTKAGMTTPTGSNGTTCVTEILEMLELAYNKGFYGPFMLYVSTGYDQFLDNDLKANSDKTTRSRIKEIDAIQDVRRLDYLTGTELLLVQMTEDVAQAVNGAEITTMQWDTKGGMQVNFKVLGIQVPRIRSVYQSGTETEVTGIVRGTF